MYHKSLKNHTWNLIFSSADILLSILLFAFLLSAALQIIRTSQATLPTSLLLNSPFSSKPIYKSSHRLRPPRLFIFISSANTANGKIKTQRIIICYLQASAIRFLLTSSIYIPTCTLKTPAHRH